MGKPRIILLTAAIALLAGTAFAQDYPTSFAKFMKSETGLYAKVIKDIGLVGQ